MRRQRAQQQQRQRFILSNIVLGALLFGVILPLGAGAGVALNYYQQFAQTLPSPQSSIYQDPVIGTTALYDRSGQTLLWQVADPLGDSREWISLDALPPALIHATLLREDPTFLERADFSVYATAQRLAYNYFYGALEQDPTLSGRLARNLAALPAPELVSATDRAREFVFVSEIQRRYTPEQSLEWFLNTNYYGNDAYGIQAAAQVYFGKPASALSLDEAAMLAAIRDKPEFNPLDDPVAARGRQADTLRDLLLNGFVSQDEYNAATATVTRVRTDLAQPPLLAREFSLYAREQAEHLLNRNGYDGARLVSRGGLRIITTLDLALYDELTCTLEAHLQQLNNTPNTNLNCVGQSYLPQTFGVGGSQPNTGAVALIDASTGELLAAVGDIQRADLAPANVLHPFVYLQGFSSSALYTPSTMLLDIPQRFPGTVDGLVYTPTNPDGRFSGPITLRQALAGGLLPPTVQVANAVGLDNILRTARLIGLSTLELNQFDLSILEQGGGVSVLDATYAYSVFANMGTMRGVPANHSSRSLRPRDPVAILRIEDAVGEVLWEYDETQRALSTTPILDTGLGYLLNDILADLASRAERYGAGNVLEFSRPSAVVNGKTSSGAWTVGYSPRFVIGAWLGRDDNAPVTLDALGLTGAAPVWRALMELSHNRYGLGAEDWERPQNIVEARVCERSGLRPNDACPQRTEIFLENTQPPQTDTYWQQLTVNRQTGQLATANTPANLREDRVFFVPPPEARDWWEANQLPLPPEQYDTITRPDLVRATVILRPELFEYVRGVVDVRGSMDADTLQYYQVAYGQGLNPTEWIDITGQRTDYTPGESLATWDTSALDGLYNLRLTAVLNDNSIDPYIVQVTVDNTPPQIALTAGDGAQVFTFLNNQTIPLVADVSDNVAIDRVEFYHNGQFVGTDDTFPFGYEHPVARVGTETFSAVVFDAAGNQANSELTVEVLRGGN